MHGEDPARSERIREADKAYIRKILYKTYIDPKAEKNRGHADIHCLHVPVPFLSEYGDGEYEWMNPRKEVKTNDIKWKNMIENITGLLQNNEK